jgi:eukaryotic-like serine/threonine-protein kinase
MIPSPLVGTVLDGKFRIERALASGASGDVYEANHLALGSKVAVKVLRPGVPETAHIRRKRFVREARVAARIASDHVVRIFDIVAPEAGLIYIVMELLNGETLADRLKRTGAMAPADAIDYVLQAAKPLAQMHDAGIVHRDVKPSNVFLARDTEGKERIKLLDFGVAAFQQPLERGDSSITLTDAIVGTPRYMAPEQVRASKDVDSRADVWALGVTLYELLAGSPPFDGQTVLAVLNQIEQQEPRLLSERRPAVSIGLARVVHRCLTKDPAHRPVDARALAEALAPYASNPLSLGEFSGRSASAHDALDLSLSDENVEVVRSGGPPSTLRTRLARLRGRRETVLIAGAIGVAAIALFAMRGLAKPALPDEVAPRAVSPPLATIAKTSVAADATISSAPIPPRLAPALPPPDPPRDATTTAHRLVEPARGSAPKKPGKSPRPAPNKTARPAAEDDDRIE